MKVTHAGLFAAISSIMMLACAVPESGQLGLPAPPPREVGGCVLELEPERLPAASMMVDTAALTDDLLALSGTGEMVQGSVLLSLEFQPDGLNVRRDLIAHEVPLATADSVQKLVFAHVTDSEEREEPWGARLRVELGSDVLYRVEARQYCPPEPRDPDIESAIEGFIGTGPRYRRGVRERVVVMRLEIHPAGYVEDARIVRGAPSGGTLEEALRQFMSQYLFEPARLDGFPVSGYIDVPIRLRD